MEKIKSVRLKAFPNVVLFRGKDDSGEIFWKSSYGSVILSEESLQDFEDSLEIEYEQERKYIDVRVECDPIYSFPDLDTIENYFRCDCGINNRLKVTKLAEGTL